MGAAHHKGPAGSRKPVPGLSVFWALAILIVVLSNSCTRGADPQQLFEHARLTYLRSDLSQARQEAHAAYLHFAQTNQEWAWKFRLLEAEILANQGLSRETLGLLDASLPASLSNGELAVKQETLQGLACALLGRFSEAEQKLQAAEDALPSYGTSLDGEVTRARGVVKLKQNDLDAAEQYFRRSLQIAETQHDQFLKLTALLNLGALALRKEHYDQAVDWSDSARQVAQSLQAEPTEEKVLGNLGWAYYKMGDFEKSLDLFDHARLQAHKLGIVVDEMLWLNNLGLVDYELGKLSDAQIYYKRALDLAKQTQNQAEITDALTELALVSARDGELDAAAKFSAEAYTRAHEKSNRLAELYTLFAMGEVAQRAGNAKQAEQLFGEIDLDTQSDSFLHWGAEHDLAMLYEQAGEDRKAETEYKRALENLEIARASLEKEESRLPFAANAVSVYDDYIHFLAERNRAADALRLADYSRSRTLAEGLGLLRKNNAAFVLAGGHPEQIARQSDATILFYWLGARQSYLWAITPKQIALFDLPPSESIDEKVRRYRNALLSPRDPLEAQNEDGIALYDILIGPAAGPIPRNSRVLIIPDGSLHSLNFETLLASKPVLHYWLEDVTVANASSLQLLATIKGQTAQHTDDQKNRTLLLVGDPVSPNRDYAALPGAAAEISQIAAQFPESRRQIFARGDATAASYAHSNPRQFSYIHFVAHGTASRLSPLDSAVILSKASAEEDSFKLYARDIIRQPLNADLVTISTCYGAGDRTYSGEGLVGLSWAFLRAGAHNVIGALWDVSDESTPGFMNQLYAGLQQGQSPGDALHAAKLSLLHSQGVFRKPFYWAPFQFYTGS